MLILNKYPKLDLHGEYASTAYSVVHSFLKDNYKMKNKYVILIHGKGTGILKNEVHNILKNEKIVKKYEVDPFNLGQTVVELDLELKK